MVSEWVKRMQFILVVEEVGGGGRVLSFCKSRFQAIFTTTEDDLQRALFKLNCIVKEYDLQISTKKTKVMGFKGTTPLRTKIMINNEMIDQVNCFNYLGCMISYEQINDVDRKLSKFQELIGTIKKTLKKKLRTDTILKFYKTMAIPTLTYGSETQQMKRAEVAEMSLLRPIAGHSLLDHKCGGSATQRLQGSIITTAFRSPARDVEIGFLRRCVTRKVRQCGCRRRCLLFHSQPKYHQQLQPATKYEIHTPASINERIPNLTDEQSDGITVFRIPPMTSLMLHRCRTGAISLQRWWQSPSAAISESDWFLYRAGISRRMTSCTVVSWRCVLLYRL
ncbi:hypothetical protein ANN_12251 [Periplaneta americana]|uniref:Reverse transcriptase domain-containing protein n=1 Tax=Periplaneta americana TaxID=6978 RepID=A0ABQ8TGA6_PERAM|nr:hypothetical protein ANN_12251 [Periplaneta americana]